jgi:Ca2+-binding EF-hand superfamily protein
MERIEKDFERLTKKKGEIDRKHLKKYLKENPTMNQAEIDEFIEGSDSQLKMNKEQFVDWVYTNGIYKTGKGSMLS